MRVLVDARDKLGISWQSCENEKQGMLVMSWEGRVGVSGVEPSEFQLYVMALSALWADTGIQEAYTRRSEFQLVSSSTPPCSPFISISVASRLLKQSFIVFMSIVFFPPKS